MLKILSYRNSLTAPMTYITKCVLFKLFFFFSQYKETCCLKVSLQLQYTKTGLENAESFDLTLCTFENIKHWKAELRNKLFPLFFYIYIYIIKKNKTRLHYTEQKCLLFYCVVYIIFTKIIKNKIKKIFLYKEYSVFAWLRPWYSWHRRCINGLDIKDREKERKQYFQVKICSAPK